MGYIWSLFLMANLCLKMSTLEERNDTLISCYICMEEELAEVKEKCDENAPDHITCVFTHELINWADVERKLDSQVVFKCLLFYYKGKGSEKPQSKRGCVAEYEGYDVCEHLHKFIKFEEDLSCELCDEKNCNSGFNFDPKINASCNLHMSPTMILTVILYIPVYLCYQ